MQPKTLTRAVAFGAALAAAAALTSCASGTPDAADTPADDLEIGAIDLSDVCPETIVIQTDWNPESEHGHLYQLLGDTYTIDAGAKSVSGPLLASGEYTGVDVEVRSGGPAIGYQTVSSQMYQDEDITLGYVSTDEAIQLSSETPTKAVYAPLDISPIMVMWDPATYPDIESIDDVAPALESTGGVWRYFGGSAYVEYLKSAGLASDAILDGSYDGTPANFISSGGTDMQQGFASAEPYIYENEVSAWGKPVDFALIHDSGWETYQSSVSVRSGDFEELTPCLEKLVPVLQQAGVDYFADPAPANALILELVTEFDNGWTYTEGVAEFAVEQQLELGLAGNGTNDTYGDFDDTRLSEFYDKAEVVYTDMGTPPADGFTVDDLYTNEFIDPSIALG